MAQAKIKKEKIEFNPETIDWSKHGRKTEEVGMHIGSFNISGKHSIEELLPSINNAVSKAYEKAVVVLTKSHGELTDIKVSWQGSYTTVKAKALENSANFEKRVIREEKVKFEKAKLEEDRKIKQKEKDLKTYEKLKLKYNLQ